MNLLEKIIVNTSSEISKFFTYSSIQAKIIATLMAIFFIIIMRRAVMGFFVLRLEDMKLRYNWSRVVSYTSVGFGIIIVGQIWLDGIGSIVTYLGLLSAGIAIALKDPITNITGWLFILWNRPLETGDRIQLGDHSGDVIDINFFNFTVMEIGNWVDADQNTGRIIHIPNGKIFIETLANYGKGFEYIFNEIPVLITFESEWEKAKKILEKIAKDFGAHPTRAAEIEIKKASQKFLIQKQKLDPVVYTKVADSGVLLTVRYLCAPKNRRDTEQEIWEEILKEFDLEPKIELAYPTIRRI
ncbi:MAG: mechanosensitive ion channel protein MscS [bacterium TMED6]|nr:MAG: mechanosensitive ion channel protein MscS [bacterium TMED6]|tara:strand:- start:11729 stop:12625 length:897 start_codon:yes stop_codon:yes gene_type:complete